MAEIEFSEEKLRKILMNLEILINKILNYWL